MVQAMVVVLGRRDSAGKEGEGAGLALSTVLPVASVRKLAVWDTLASPRALDIVMMMQRKVSIQMEGSRREGKADGEEDVLKDGTPGSVT